MRARGFMVLETEVSSAPKTMRLVPLSLSLTVGPAVVVAGDGKKNDFGGALGEEN